LDMKRLNEAFSKVGKAVDPHMLETLNILVPYNGNLVCSNGGLILFGQDKYREKYFPNTVVRCARFQGNKKVDFVDQYDSEGTILEAIHEVPKFIKRNTRLAASIEKIERKDIPEYSPIVIREVLANALVHADYSIQGMNPRVAIFADRLEIESPGMLPFGYTLTDFFAGVSHVRNKVIARVFRELNIIEEWGTGYRRIKEACQVADYPIPNWQELGASLRVILNPHLATQEKLESTQPPLQSELTVRQEVIVKLLHEGDTLTTKEIHKRLKSSISERTLRKDLLSLKEKGMIKTLGRGPSTQWKLIREEIP